MNLARRFRSRVASLRRRVAGGVMPVVLPVLLLACGKPAPKLPPGVTVSDAWVRATPDTGVTTAVYLTLNNGFPKPITVSGFASDVARTVELHESMTDAHMMSHMRPVPSLRLPADSSVTLQPNGLHLMLIGTTRPLKAGELIRLVMRLSNGSIIMSSAVVRAP